MFDKLIDKKDELEIELQRKEEQLELIQDEKSEIEAELSDANRLIFKISSKLHKKCIENNIPNSAPAAGGRIQSRRKMRNWKRITKKAQKRV
jgi:hypothetical protein